MYATLHFGLGNHVRVAQDLLGHARSDMTLDIYQFGASCDREAVMRLGEVFDRARLAGASSRRRHAVAWRRPGLVSTVSN